jgi:methionyl-tRNA synthetase
VAAPALAASASDAKPAIAYDDFAKLELKVGVVLSAERVKKKDKLLDLRVDAGEAEPRRIVAGIATSYAPEALVGKRVVLLANLPPREFGKGLVSQGMLLAAEDAAGLRVVTVDGEAGPGSKVR